MEELALAYWKSLTGQPKAQLYAKAIALKLKGESPGIERHELMNAIDSGASFAKAQGMKPAKTKA